MATTTEPPPDGFTESYDPTTWNVGHVFRWSDVYKAWLDCDCRISIKPNTNIAESFEEQTDESIIGQYVFFVEGF